MKSTKKMDDRRYGREKGSQNVDLPRNDDIPRDISLQGSLGGIGQDLRILAKDVGSEPWEEGRKSAFDSRGLRFDGFLDPTSCDDRRRGEGVSREDGT